MYQLLVTIQEVDEAQGCVVTVLSHKENDKATEEETSRGKMVGKVLHLVLEMQGGQDCTSLVKGLFQKEEVADGKNN